MSNHRKLILNEEIPVDLRLALDQEAEQENVTVNDVATRILSEYFKCDWEPSGFQFRPLADRFKLRVPSDLHREIRIRAAKDLVTVRGVALSILADHYGTTLIDAHRRPRKEAV